MSFCLQSHFLKPIRNFRGGVVNGVYDSGQHYMSITVTAMTIIDISNMRLRKMEQQPFSVQDAVLCFTFVLRDDHNSLDFTCSTRDDIPDVVQVRQKRLLSLPKCTWHSKHTQKRRRISAQRLSCSSRLPHATTVMRACTSQPLYGRVRCLVELLRCFFYAVGQSVEDLAKVLQERRAQRVAKYIVRALDATSRNHSDAAGSWAWECLLILLSRPPLFDLHASCIDWPGNS
nr:hypothetical protein CFP56_69066 [Quercus suber]